MSESEQRVVLVTGAAAGMGLATARRFLAGGARVIVWDIDARALAAAWADVATDRAHRGVVDVADADDVHAALGDALQRLGRLDVVVNNAALHGASWVQPCLTMSPDQWKRLVEVNILGIVNVARAAADALAVTGGVVVNISSMTAYGHGPSSGYAVTKAAVNALTTSLADELGQRGVRVVGVAPGFVATDTVRATVPAERQAALMTVQSLPRMGGPGDIAAITEFMASPEAWMIVGQTVVADVGITRRP